VRSGETLAYPIQFNVPALVPNVEVPHCIHTEYRLQLDVGFMRNSPKGAPVRIKVPIRIGTHLANITADGLPSAPPAYDQISCSKQGASTTPTMPDSPPVYTASVSGLSTVEDGEAQNNYTPLCYHYNFAFTADENDPKEAKKTQ